MLSIIEKVFPSIHREISYYRVINDSSLTILFIHGLGENKNWFEKDYHQHSLEYWNWIVPDLIGFGKSTKPTNSQPYMMLEQARQLFQLLKHEKVDELVIIAHSMGGPIAIALLEMIEKEKKHGINPTTLYYLEGNIDINDATWSSQIASFSRIDYQQEFYQWLDCFDRSSDNFQKYNEIGAFPLWASSIDLVGESKSNQLLPRLQRQIEYHKLIVQAFYGEKNRGQYTSENKLRNIGIEVIYIQDAEHFMYLDNPNEFWSIIKTRLFNK